MAQEYAKSLIKPPPDENALQKQNSLFSISSNKSNTQDKEMRDESEERVSDSSWDVMSEDHDERESGQQLASPDRKKERSGSVPSGFLGKVISKVTSNNDHE